MSIQSISSSYQTQMNSVRSDFQDFQEERKSTPGCFEFGEPGSGYDIGECLVGIVGSDYERLYQ